jgi:hypothetical protein
VQKRGLGEAGAGAALALPVQAWLEWGVWSRRGRHDFAAVRYHMAAALAVI